MEDDYTFKIAEENEDPEQVVIEMGGITNQFTLAKLREHERFTKKRMEEAQKQMQVNSIDIGTLEALSPEFADLDESAYKACMDYIGKKTENSALQLLVAECEKVLDSYKRRYVQIENALDLGIKTEEHE